ncbi:hypothetical protein CDAR_194211 [Caerostris darwini]|uniref:Uncharacterized protein n=1 Tax=Caerostris darwini TaxID=1538125 RepID=A0AAV4Q0Z3_9ARAC|nr:hypothetical protein CDAR_194211 [Caerostris darwini]
MDVEDIRISCVLVVETESLKLDVRKINQVHMGFYGFPPTAVNFPARKAIGNSERKLFHRLPKEFDFYLQTRFPEIEKTLLA